MYIVQGVGLFQFWNGSVHLKQFSQTLKESYQIFQRPQIISCLFAKKRDIKEMGLTMTFYCMKYFT